MNFNKKIVSAKNIGLPYTERSFTVSCIMMNKREFVTDFTYSLTNYTSFQKASDALNALNKDFDEKVNCIKSKIEQALDDDAGYLRLGNYYIRVAQCSVIKIELNDNSSIVVKEMEEMPAINGWPWKEGSCRAN